MRVLITAWRLMFSSLAARSSSSNMPCARSTLTRWIGAIIRPALVKHRDTSLPRSARRAMVSAGTGLPRLRVLFIKLLFLPGRAPERYEAVILSFFVLAHFENERIQLSRNPTDSAALLGQIGALVQIVRMREHFLRFLESDAAFRIRPEPGAFALVKLESH